MIFAILEYYRDSYILSINNIELSSETHTIKPGDILRVGIKPDGFISAFWEGYPPLQHYGIVLDIESKLYIIHTWHLNHKKGNIIHIPPIYQIQLLSDYFAYSGMRFYILFRNPNLNHKSYSLEYITNLLKSYQLNCRCYVLINYLLKDLYPDKQMVFSSLKHSALYTAFFYNPKRFEKYLKTYGYQQIPSDYKILTVN